MQAPQAFTSRRHISTIITPFRCPGLFMFRLSALALLLAIASAAPALELNDCRISAGPGYPGIKARCGTLLRPLDPDDAEAAAAH